MKFILAVIFFMPFFLYSQGFDPAEVNPRIEKMNDEEKVNFIIDHFYELYSADFDNAIHHTKSAIEISEHHNWESSRAYALMFHGIVNYLRGNYEQALESFITAEKLFEKLEDLDGLARLSNEMANFFQKQKDFEKSIAYLDKGEQIARQANNLVQLGTNYGMRGTFLVRRNKYEEAQPYFIQVFEIRKQQNDSVGLGYVYLNLADYEVYKGKLDKAIAYIDTSNMIREKIGDLQGVSEGMHAMGNAYATFRKYQLAVAAFEKSNEIAQSIGYLDQIRLNFQALEKIAIKTDDFQYAHLYLQKFQQYNDSLFSINRTRVIKDLETKYEVEKKENQLALQKSELENEIAQNQKNLAFIFALVIALLATGIILLLLRSRYQKNKELMVRENAIKLQEAQLDAAISSQERERTRFAKDLHDGFGQMISVLNLNLKALDSSKNSHEVYESSAKILEEMHSELKSICFNLMPQTLIKFGLGKALDEFVLRINNTGQKHIEVDLFGLDNRLPELYEISIYRVIQEWVNNILKYSDANRIDIQITRDENELTLLIEDNGMGFDKQVLIEGSGNGWKNINSRLSLINGDIELDTVPNRRGNTLIADVVIDVVEMNKRADVSNI